MSRRGECIYKRRDGRWEARYVKEIGPDGRKRYGSVYAGSYREAKDKQLLFLTQPPKAASSGADITVSELMQKWLLHNRNQVKPSSYQKYERLIRNHIDNTIGQVPVRFVTGSTVEQFSNEQLLNGKVGGGELSRKTVNDILTVLSLAFSFTEEEYGIQCPKIHFLKERKKETRVLSKEEQEKLTAYLINDMDIYRFGVLLALYTGIRLGELCALKWEYLSEDAVEIRSTMQRLKGKDGHTEILIGDPKSESSKRMIPLPFFLKPFIERFRKSEGFVLGHGLCEYTEPRLMQYKFEKMIAECGLSKINFHALRHTFATRCIEAGFDVKSLSEILGHSDVKTTLNRYVHSSFEFKRLNMAKLPAPTVS